MHPHAHSHARHNAHTRMCILTHSHTQEAAADGLSAQLVASAARTVVPSLTLTDDALIAIKGVCARAHTRMRVRVCVK